MANEWLRIALCVPVAMVDGANAIAARFEPDRGDGNSFNVRASRNGQEPATHYMAEVLVKPSTRLAVLSLKAGSAIPSWLQGDMTPEDSRRVIDAILVGDGFTMPQLMSAHQLLKIPEPA